MNLREQFEKETGKCAKMNGMLLTYFNSDYVQWLEQRNKEQVEVLEICNKYVTKDWSEESMDEMIECHEECVKLTEEQLKKSHVSEDV